MNYILENFNCIPLIESLRLKWWQRSTFCTDWHIDLCCVSVNTGMKVLALHSHLFQLGSDRSTWSVYHALHLIIQFCQASESNKINENSVCFFWIRQILNKDCFPSSAWKETKIASFHTFQSGVNLQVFCGKFTDFFGITWLFSQL